MKEIRLTRGQVALVDDEDFEYLNRWKWHAQPSRGTFYVVRSGRRINGKRAQIRMHRVLLGMIETKILTDHKDGNGLNNQKQNIRPATVGQNNFNKRGFKNSTSSYKGVCWYPRNKKWGVKIRVKGQPQKFLGLFLSEIEAAKAYDIAAKAAHGEFAKLNFKI